MDGGELIRMESSQCGWRRENLNRTEPRRTNVNGREEESHSKWRRDKENVTDELTFTLYASSDSACQLGIKKTS